MSAAGWCFVRLLTGLRQRAVQLRIYPGVVQRPRQDGDGDRADFRAVGIRATEVVPLPGGQNADSKPDDDQQADQPPDAASSPDWCGGTGAPRHDVLLALKGRGAGRGNSGSAVVLPASPRCP